MIEAPEKVVDISRVRILAALITFGLALIIARLWFLQIVHGDELMEASIVNQRRLIRRVPPRGQIVDSSGIVIASNRQQFVVSVVPYEVRKYPEVLEMLAKLLNQPEADIQGAVNLDENANSYDAMRVAVDVDMATVTRIEEQRATLPGVYVYPEPIRQYADGKLYGHILGQMGQIQPDELKRRKHEGYRAGDFCGKLGLERQYDHELRGLNGGRQIEVDAKGRLRNSVSEDEPVPGATLKLTIRSELQRIAYEELEAWAKGKRKGASRYGNPGSVVAIDPRDGSVLVLASYPSIDPNLFVKGIKKKDWDELRDDPATPLVHRAVGSGYAPGSTFKLITATAGLECEAASPNSTDFCAGEIYVGRTRKTCTSSHGSIDFYHAIAKSCNVFFYHLGQRLGPAYMAKYAKEYGMGERTGIDLPGVELAGHVPDPASKKHHWVGGDTVDFAIGQSSLSCTPLQMCNMTAAIANGGTLYQPKLVQSTSFNRTVDEAAHVNVSEPIIKRKVGVSVTTLDRIRRGMRMVQEPGGTGSAANVSGITIAGKTGTAQANVRHIGIVNNAWYVGYAPADNPTIAICVFIEHGGHGGEAAAPIAQKIFARYFRMKAKSVESTGTRD